MELGNRPDYIELYDDDTEFDESQDTVIFGLGAVEEQLQSIETKDENGATLPLGFIEEQQEAVMNQLIHKHYRQESSLARDVAYLGATDIPYVLATHNITHKELLEKLATPVFAKLVEKFQKEIGDDSGGMLKVRTQAYLDTGISRLQQVIMNRDTKDENVIKAMQLMATLGGAMPKAGSDSGGGMKIEFNFGNNNPMIQAKAIIEGTAE